MNIETAFSIDDRVSFRMVVDTSTQCSLCGARHSGPAEFATKKGTVRAIRFSYHKGRIVQEIYTIREDSGVILEKPESHLTLVTES